MSRVAKAGYIETPSPISEMCRGVDAGSPEWRGYIHHRYFVWNDKGTLRFMTKYPVVDHLDFGDLENVIVDALKQNPILWNTYFAWEDEITFEYYQHEVDYHLINGQLEKWYGEMIIESIDQSYESGLEFTKNLLS
jgi:hypothetical protein